jgi:hypothetical protein
MGLLCICGHYNTEHEDATGPCTATACECRRFVRHDLYSDSLTEVTEQLQAQFDRSPTLKEIYRFMWGDKETRKRIWRDRGLPEGQRYD